jgi:hypothetical protein
MKRVVLSCTHSSTYDFFLPISIRIWKKRIGYEPVVFLVGGPAEWNSGHRKVVLDEVYASKCPVTFIERVPGIPDPNLSMSIRQHAAALPFIEESDLLIIGDVDLIPIRKEFYHQHDPLEFPIAIYHAEMYWRTYWPAYGPSMTAKVWREVMGLTVGDLMGSLRRTFEAGKIEELISAQKADYTDSRLWIFDEQYASSRINNSAYSEKILKIGDGQSNRLCRNSFSDTVDVSKCIDFHCHRPGWSHENWKKIRGILSQVIPGDLQWLDRYQAEYACSGPLVGDPFA